MTIYSFHIFDRTGRSLFQKEWLRPKPSTMDKEQEKKLLFGMVHSIKSFVDKMSPVDGKDGFKFAGSYTTSKYKLHFYETPTGLQLIMMTDTTVGLVTDTLKKIYASVYVKYGVRNPLVDLTSPIESNLFATKLDELVTNLPFYLPLAT